MNDISSQSKLSAIVTGASSGIGKAIASTLVRFGYEVYGFGRNFNSNDDDVIPVVIDLLDTNKVVSKVDGILNNTDVRVLVNCAGVAYYGLHENISVKHIQEIIRVDLEVPVIISSLVLSSFKQKKNSYIINISSVTGTKASPHAAAYGAAKAGLIAFGNSIWEEARKHGVCVTSIEPDMTDTNLYRNADFGIDDDARAYLVPEDIANAVEYVLSMREGTNINSLKIMPRYNRIKRK